MNNNTLGMMSTLELRIELGEQLASKRYKLELMGMYWAMGMNTAEHKEELVRHIERLERILMQLGQFR